MSGRQNDAWGEEGFYLDGDPEVAHLGGLTWHVAATGEAIGHYTIAAALAILRGEPQPE